MNVAKTTWLARSTDGWSNLLRAARKDPQARYDLWGRLRKFFYLLCRIRIGEQNLIIKRGRERERERKNSWWKAENEREITFRNIFNKYICCEETCWDSKVPFATWNDTFHFGAWKLLRNSRKIEVRHATGFCKLMRHAVRIESEREKAWLFQVPLFCRRLNSLRSCQPKMCSNVTGLALASIRPSVHDTKARQTLSSSKASTYLIRADPATFCDE